MTKLVWLWGLLLCSTVAAQPSPQPPPAPAPAPAPPQDQPVGDGSAAPAPAPTSPPPPADPNTEAAKVHFEQGVALFNDGNFVAALAEFEQSYKLKPAPFVLKNVALT
jgi:hypothetical protein